MPKCLDCNQQVSMAHAFVYPEHRIVSTSNRPLAQYMTKDLIDRQRRRIFPPEPTELEGADETYNIRKEHATDDTQPSLWWLAIPAAIAIGVIIFVHRSNRNKEVGMPSQDWDTYYG